MDDAPTEQMSEVRPSLSALINSMTEAVVITDMRMRILELNRTAGEMLGGQEAGMELNLGSSEWENSKLDALLHLSTGKSFEFQCNIAERQCTATFTPVITGEEVNAVYCQIRQTAESETPDGKLSAFLNAFSEPLFIMTRQGKIADCNAAAASLTSSIGFETCRGIEFLEMVGKSHRVDFVEMFKKCQSEGHAAQAELEMSGPQGKSVSVQFAMSAIGAVTGAGLFLLSVQGAKEKGVCEGGTSEDERAAGRNVGRLMKELLPFTERSTYFSILAGKLSETGVADAVIIFSNEGDKISVIAQAACPPALSRRILSRDYDFPFETPLVRSGVPVIIDQVSPHFQEFCKLYRGYSSMLIVPVKTGRAVAGSIAVLRREDGKTVAEDLTFLREVSDMVGDKLPTFVRIEELRHLNLMYERLDGLASRFEAEARLSMLHASIAREYRLLLHAETSCTFFQRPGAMAFVCVASEGHRLRHAAGEMLSLPPEFLSAIPETVEKASARHETLLHMLGCQDGNVVYIIPHNAAGYRGFTAAVLAKGREPDWMELSIAERSRRHIDYVLSAAERISSLEMAVHRARLLNLVSEACISASDPATRLELLMRYLTDAIPDSDATACVVRGHSIVSRTVYRKPRPSSRIPNLPAGLDEHIIEVSRSLKASQIKGSIASAQSSSTSGPDSNYLLVPVCGHDGGATVVVISVQHSRRLEYGEIEFAEFLSAAAVEYGRTTGEALRNVSESTFASSLSSLLGGVLSAPPEIPFPAAFSSEIGRFVPHDDLLLLVEEGDGFGRKVFSLKTNAPRTKGTIISLAEIEAVLENDGMRQDEGATQITSLFGTVKGHAIAHRLRDRSGRTAGILMLWRNASGAFSDYERRLVHSAVLAASGALCRNLS